MTIDIDINTAANALIGKTVRAWDFLAGVGKLTSSHVVGRVVAITDPDTHPAFRDCPRYAIAVTEEHWEGEVSPARPGKVVYPPINGTQTSWRGDIIDRVQVIEGGAA